MRMLNSDKSTKFMVLILSILTIFILSACGNRIPDTPDDIDQTLWEDSYEIINMIKYHAEKEEGKSQEQNNIIEVYKKKHFIDKETFDNQMSEFYTLTEEVLILHVITIVNSFDHDYLSQFDDDPFDFSATFDAINDFEIFIRTLD